MKSSMLALYYFKEVNDMENKTPNHSIECSVKQCAHHCGNVNFCALDSVRIATHEANPTECKCTDCESFRANDSCGPGMSNCNA